LIAYFIDPQTCPLCEHIKSGKNKLWRPMTLSSVRAVGLFGSLVCPQRAKTLSIAYIILESIFVYKYSVPTYMYVQPK